MITAASGSTADASMLSEGCSCCRDNARHALNAERLAVLLRVPKYKDGSGYDFTRFSTASKALRARRR